MFSTGRHQRPMISRRTLAGGLALTAGLSLSGLASRGAGATRQDQSTLTLPGIGLPVAAWEERFGAGEEIDALRQVFRYEHPDQRRVTLYATVVDDIITHVETDYSGTVDGAADPDAATDDLDALLPRDARSTAAYLTGGTSAGETIYAWQRYTSDALARATGGDGTVLVGYQLGVPVGSGTLDHATIRTTVTMGIASEPEVTGWETPGGFGMTMDQVDRFWGPGEAGQSGWAWPGLGIDGGDILAGTTRVDGEQLITTIRVFWGDDLLADGTDGTGATTQLRGLLPYDAIRTGIFPLPPTPDGPIGLICEHWQSASLGERLDGRDTILSVTWHNGNDAPVIPRLDIMAESD